MAVTDTRMLRHWIAKSGVNAGPWKDRFNDATSWVCPKCDAYALGGEFTHGLAFYSGMPAAFLTVNDWDWWNQDPRECDIREWPDFGCLTFSESALRSTVEFLCGADRKTLDDTGLFPFEPELIPPTGIPEDDNAEIQWHNQLSVLHARMRGELSTRELDAAVRTFVRMLPG
ncbi:MAG: hypothetical protein ACYC9L_12095 [Sulfuricaulis sp.]